MRARKIHMKISNTRLILAPMVAVAFLTATANAATPGITGTAFSLTAQQAFLNQPDGEAVYSWGYGCAATYTPAFLPTAIANPACPTMQVPGPTLIVREGTTVAVTLTNNQTVLLKISSITVSGDYAATPGGTTPCGASVAAKGKCTFQVTFTPTITGIVKGAVGIAHDAQGSPQVVGLTGTGQ